MSKQLERPFEYLRRKDGSSFSKETVNRWYEARAYVLDKLKDVAIGPLTKEHLHVLVASDTPLMLSAIRQLALSCHYANFNEEPIRNRTVITLVSKNKTIIEELKKEEYLSNLPDQIQYSLFGAKPVNDNSFLDIELRVVEEWNEENTDGILKLSDEDAGAFLSTKSPEEVYSIDTRMAVLVGRIYSLGTMINNLPFEDIHSPSRYALALDFFQHGLLREPIQPLVDEQRFNTDLTFVRNNLSSISTSDCFYSRAQGLKKDGKNVKNPWEEFIEELSMSEHARWTTEKLVMGFRALNDQERLCDERLFSSKKAQYRKQLKSNSADPVHIDICSFADLRRIFPEDLKYDSFLMLAIPMIFERVKKPL